MFKPEWQRMTEWSSVLTNFASWAEDEYLHGCYGGDGDGDGDGDDDGGISGGQGDAPGRGSGIGSDTAGADDGGDGDGGIGVGMGAVGDLSALGFSTHSSFGAHAGFGSFANPSAGPASPASLGFASPTEAGIISAPFGARAPGFTLGRRDPGVLADIPNTGPVLTPSRPTTIADIITGIPETALSFLANKFGVPLSFNLNQREVVTNPLSKSFGQTFSTPNSITAGFAGLEASLTEEGFDIGFGPEVETALGALEALAEKGPVSVQQTAAAAPGIEAGIETESLSEFASRNPGLSGEELVKKFRKENPQTGGALQGLA